MHKFSNRINVGLILASLFIGAAHVMRVLFEFRILESPGFAMTLFALAAIGSAWMLVRMQSQDHRHEREVSRTPHARNK